MKIFGLKMTLIKKFLRIKKTEKGEKLKAKISKKKINKKIKRPKKLQVKTKIIQRFFFIFIIYILCLLLSYEAFLVQRQSLGDPTKK